MNNLKTKQKIKELLGELDKMAYGMEIHNKTLPPNKYHYNQLVDRIIKLLRQIESENIIEVIDKILSIRDNQLREFLISQNQSFERYGVDKEMECITGQIHLHIDCILSEINLK